MKFWDHILGANYWDKQREIQEAIMKHQRVTVRSCHGSGKSYTAARATLTFVSVWPDSIALTTAPTFRQVEDVIWREIRDAYNKSKAPLGGTMLKTSWTVDEKWYAKGISSDRSDNLQGYHAEHLLLTVDEPPGLSDDILEAAEGLLTSENVHLLYIGNPTIGYGKFYDSHSSSQFCKIKIDVFDTPNFKENNIRGMEDLKRFKTAEELALLKIPYPKLVTPLWAWQRLQDWGADSPIFQARVLAEFPQEGDDTLIGLNLVVAAIAKIWEDDKIKSWNRRNCIGVDVARFGGDTTTATAMNNHRMLAQRRHNGKDLMATCGMVIDLFNEMGFAKEFDLIAIDDTGLGGGVTDRLKEQGYSVLPVNFGSAPVYDTEKENLKAEIYWNMRQIFKDGDISILDVGKLAAQIPTIRYDFSSRGRLQIVSKKKMKEEGMDSPDDADSLAIALWGIKHCGQTAIDIGTGRGGTVAGNLYNKQF